MLLSEVGKWLLDLFQRFDCDIELLLNEEPFWKVCHQCPDGNCCTKPIVPTMGEEWSLIRNFVKERFSVDEKKKLLRNIKAKQLQCIFLVNNRCSIYPVRPWACRIFPYTISFYSSPITKQVGGLALPSCPTLASAFSLKVGELFFHRPPVLYRHSSGRLVKCKLKKHRPLWLIDISEYWHEYEQNMPKNEAGTLEGWNMHEWVGFAKYARETGLINDSKFLEQFGLD